MVGAGANWYGHGVSNATRVAPVLLEEEIGGLFFVHLRDARWIRRRTSILKLVG